MLHLIGLVLKMRIRQCAIWHVSIVMDNLERALKNSLEGGRVKGSALDLKRIAEQFNK
jgi:hypothetical protein